jgi:hypothetical protein
MAYVGTPYKNDIFISYANESNEAGWVDYFRKRLEIGVRSKLALLENQRKTTTSTNQNYKIGIWFDQEGRMHGNHAVTKQLSDGVRSSATLIIIVSRHYWRSVWPAEERTWFVEAIMDGSDPNKKFLSKNRIFIVKQEDCLPEPLPECFLGDDGVPLVGYKFFKDNSETIWPKTDSDAWTPSFLEAMEELEQDLAEQLCKIRHGGEMPDPTSPKPSAVFLGHVNAHLKRLRTEVREDLEQQGIVVLPPRDQDVMYDMALLRSAFSSFLCDATIFVQLLNENCGEGPPEDPLGNIGFQLGLVRAQPGIQILEFVTSYRKEELDILGASDEYKNHLKNIKEKSPYATEFNADIISKAIVDESNAIADARKRNIERAFRTITVGATSDALRQSFLVSFLQLLVANQPRLIPGIIPAGSKAEEIRGALKNSDVVIMLWKDKSMDWLRYQLGELLLNPEMILEQRRNNKRNIIVIYPETPATFPIFTTEFYVVIDGVNNSEEEIRAKILEDISSWITMRPLASDKL